MNRTVSSFERNTQAMDLSPFGTTVKSAQPEAGTASMHLSSYLVLIPLFLKRQQEYTHEPQSHLGSAYIQLNHSNLSEH